MGLLDAIKSGFWNYSEFSGRASRAEYWLWHLFVMLLCIPCIMLDTAWFPSNSPGPIYKTAFIVTFIPGICVSIRRLHDVGKSGFWFLIAFTGIGSILLIYWFLISGEKKANAYGLPPSS